MNTAKLLEIVIKADHDLIDGVQLYLVQQELRNYQRDIVATPLAERFEVACYGKTKAKVIPALIHCRCILNGSFQ